MVEEVKADIGGKRNVKLEGVEWEGREEGFHPPFLQQKGLFSRSRAPRGSWRGVG
jgi:hypothetical protein